jgi:hypothetical protein
MSFYEELQELVRRTRNNPELFHRLVYEPETVLGEIGFLSEEAKRQILGLSPAELTAKLLGCEHGTPGAQQQGCDAGTICVGCSDQTCENTFCGNSICNDCATACNNASQGCSDCTAASQCVQCTEKSCQVGACTDATCRQSCGNPSGCAAASDAVEITSVAPSFGSTSDNFREFRL